MNKRSRRVPIAWLVASLTGSLAAAAGLAARTTPAVQGQAAEPGSLLSRYARMTADIEIRHSRVDGNGHPFGPDTPSMVLRLDRHRHGNQWSTVMTMKSGDARSIESVSGRQTVANPFAIARIELDGDGSAPRMFDGRGVLIPIPGEAARRALGLPEQARKDHWDSAAVLAKIGLPPGIDQNGPAAGWLIEEQDRAGRRAALERQFGRSAGQHRGLDRYLAETGGEVREVLAEPATALPAEVSVARAGRLIARTVFEYQPVGTGVLLRRRIRAERALGPQANERLISEIALSNLSLGEAVR